MPQCVYYVTFSFFIPFNVSGEEADWQLALGRLKFKRLSGRAHFLSAPPALVLPAFPASSADPWCCHRGSPVCLHQ